MIDVRSTDLAFYTSPDVGDPTCYCSRCHQLIPDGIIPIRLWPPDEDDPREYRYHPHCQGLDDDQYQGEETNWVEADGEEWKRQPQR